MLNKIIAIVTTLALLTSCAGDPSKHSLHDRMGLYWDVPKANVTWEKLNDASASEESKKHYLKQLQAFADRGFPRSLVILAALHLNGISVEKDPDLAFKLVTRAAETGDAYATGQLAGYYAYGLGTQRDPEKAVLHAKTAAEMDDLHGRRILAELQYQGLGIEKNVEAAIKTLIENAQKKDRQALAFLAKISKVEGGIPARFTGTSYLTGENVQKDVVRGHNLLTWCAYPGNNRTILPECQFLLGTLLIKGEGDIKQQYDTGKRLIGIAANSGLQDAVVALKDLNEAEQLAVEKANNEIDRQIALENFKRSAGSFLSDAADVAGAILIVGAIILTAGLLAQGLAYSGKGSRNSTTYVPTSSTKSQQSGGCECRCVNGEVRALCSSAISLPPICGPRVCGVVPPSISPIAPPTVPPVGTSACAPAQVLNPVTEQYEWRTVCR